MKRNLSVFLVVLLFLPTLACGSFTTNVVRGSGEIVTQTFDVRNFERVSLEGFGAVFIEQGRTEGLSVQTDDNILSLVDVKVRGDELILGIQYGYDVTPSQSITFNLTVKDLTAVAIEGSGSIFVEPVKSSSLAVSIQGSGDIDIKGLAAEDLWIKLDGSGNISIRDVNVKAVDTSLQGSGNIRLEGNTDSQKVTVNGSGTYLAESLEATSADISIPGSGDITVWVRDELIARVNGSGDIRYYGQPTIHQSGSGSGNLISLGDK